MSSLGIQRRGIAGVYYLPVARDLEDAIGERGPAGAHERRRGVGTEAPARPRQLRSLSKRFAEAQISRFGVRVHGAGEYPESCATRRIRSSCSTTRAGGIWWRRGPLPSSGTRNPSPDGLSRTRRLTHARPRRLHRRNRGCRRYRSGGARHRHRTPRSDDRRHRDALVARLPQGARRVAVWLTESGRPTTTACAAVMLSVWTMSSRMSVRARASAAGVRRRARGGKRRLGGGRRDDPGGERPRRGNERLRDLIPFGLDLLELPVRHPSG